jgi:hypothetical protein
VQRVATERPWSPLYESEGCFISQETASGERVCGVEAWCEERCAARERGKSCRDEPAAHVYDEKTADCCRCIIGDRMLPCTVVQVARLSCEGSSLKAAAMHVTLHFGTLGPSSCVGRSGSTTTLESTYFVLSCNTSSTHTFH